jgi:hypothetical protein
MSLECGQANCGAGNSGAHSEHPAATLRGRRGDTAKPLVMQRKAGQVQHILMVSLGSDDADCYALNE